MLPGRRKFLMSLGAGVATSSMLVSKLRAQAKVEWPIAIFEKVFEALDFEELADAVAETGADGIEATIRPGGHVEPAVAAEAVPQMAAALEARGKSILIAATNIGGVDEPTTEPLLRTLKSVGINHYRMSHYHIDLSKSPLKQVREYAARARELAALNQEIGIQGLYQNHSGGNRRNGRGYLGSLGWDVALMLEGIDPSALGIAFDTRHLRKDTGASWETAVAVCKPHVRAIYVKDGMWLGERGDQYKDVPLNTGFVNKQIFDAMRQGLGPMPLCIHMEWLGYRVFEKHEIPSAISAHQRDIKTLKSWL